MKILHTADWHIGKRLHKYDLDQDFSLFVDWLVATVQAEQVDLVLVSGDIFDLANPSSEARKLYFNTLLKLQQLNCKLILTGGNHDSPAVLNGPKELLEVMDIHVIGSLPADINDCLIPVKNKQGAVELVVAAIPYLRDADLRSANDGFDHDSREQAVREGIKRTFQAAAEACAKLYPQTPAIAMGHLFATGVTTSDSEREIQVGNLGSFDANGFGDFFKYVALGHIHKPQKVSAIVPTYYSGSPLPLSFSERSDQKRVLILDTADYKAQSLAIPVYRRLKKLSGSFMELRAALEEFQPEGELDTLLELELIQERSNTSEVVELDRLVREFGKAGVQIVKHRALIQKEIEDTAQRFTANQQLEDLQPREVFRARLDQESYDEETRQLVLEAFDQILEETLRSDQNED